MNNSTQENENFYLTKTPVGKLLLKFAIPCVLAMLVSALYNIVDQIFLGHSSAGSAGIMATTLVFPFTVVALALALMIGDGCASLFSISLGSGDQKTAKRSIGNSVFLLVCSSIVLVVLGLSLKGPILSLLGAKGYDTTTQLFAKQYMTIIIAGIPFYMFASAMASVIRADGSPKFSMLTTIVGALINLALDPIFIFVFKMGVEGAAIATIIGQFVSAVLCFIYFWKFKLVKLEKDSFKPERKTVGKTLKLGISSLITQISIAIITIVANNVVGAIGGENATDAGAALGIVFKVFAIIIAFAVGISVGAQPIVGYNYGAKKYNRVLKAFKLVIICNIILGIVATILFELAPSVIVSLFGKGSAFYKQYANGCFRIYLGGICLCCLQKACCIFLQSIDKPYKAMILSLMRDVILLVPGVCIMGLCGDLQTMLWAGLIADAGAFIPTVIFAIVESKKLKKLQLNGDTYSENKPQTNHFVITIGREFGSGGKYIGEQLAQRLGINCYDHQLVEKAAKEFNLDQETLEKLDEKEKSSFWYGYANTHFINNQLVQLAPADQLFLKQSKTIEELAQNEDCVIVGRCADVVLKGKANTINLFVFSSDLDFKIERKSHYENISKEAALAKIKKTDKQRAEYYNHYTSQVWGDANNYHLCVDTAKLGVEKSIDVIEEYVKSFLDKSNSSKKKRAKK